MCSEDTFNINLKFKNKINCDCFLGEGLLLNDDEAVWVDIDKDMLFIHKNDILFKKKLNYKPSVILNISKTSILIGCDVGVVKFDRELNQQNIISPIINQHKVNSYRSNDGCLFNNYFLISFMHRDDPDMNPGYLYSVKGKNWNLLDNTLHIPNTFLKIGDNNILISDSQNRSIWIYNLDEKGNLLNKRLWAQLDENLIPDGGCLIDNLVFISNWDGACLSIFEINGKLLGNLDVPTLRPTNCKYNSKTNELWVTSALRGLSKDQIKSFPYSGSTLVFEVQK